jgi:hypothetical protein
MIYANAPLHKWREFDVNARGNYGLRGKEDTRKIAAAILKQCGHNEVVELVAKEFDQFPERLRIDFRTLATQENAASGNVRKGLQRLNERMGGKLLREDNARVFNRRIETADGVRYKRVEVNEAIAAAKRKYGRL